VKPLGALEGNQLSVGGLSAAAAPAARPSRQLRSPRAGPSSTRVELPPAFATFCSVVDPAQPSAAASGTSSAPVFARRHAYSLEDRGVGTGRAVARIDTLAVKRAMVRLSACCSLRFVSLSSGGCSPERAGCPSGDPVAQLGLDARRVRRARPLAGGRRLRPRAQLRPRAALAPRRRRWRSSSGGVCSACSGGVHAGFCSSRPASSRSALAAIYVRYGSQPRAPRRAAPGSVRSRLALLAAAMLR
jgi:hypothetical protein